MILTVRVPSWELEEDGRIPRVGDTLSSWLTFRDAEEIPPHGVGVQVVHGHAHALSAWPGGTLGRHPVRIDLDGAALYWDAPEQVEGAIHVTGTVCTNNVAAPDDFPETRGVVRRLRMEWKDVVMGSDGVWRGAGGGPRYEEVQMTYLPRVEAKALDPAVEADLMRRAREAYDRELSQGRLRPGDPFAVSFAVRHPEAATQAGATEAQWTGVLLDLDIAGLPDA